MRYVAHAKPPYEHVFKVGCLMGEYEAYEVYVHGWQVNATLQYNHSTRYAGCTDCERGGCFLFANCSSHTNNIVCTSYIRALSS